MIETSATTQLPRITTNELTRHRGERVRTEGWLHAIRRLGGLTFLTLRDGWGTIQVVAEGEMADQIPAGLTPESVVRIVGTVADAPRAPGGLELREPLIEVIAAAESPLPVTLGKREMKASLATLLDHAVLANRHPSRRALFRLASVATGGFRETLLARGFTEIHTPKLVAAATESGANVFPVSYFGRDAYLAQSPQLYKQIMVGVFERVFEVGPVFRAEPHDTTRHLNEYVSLDAEMGFIESHEDVMAMLRDVIAGIFDAMRVSCAAELALLDVRLPAVPERIPSLHITEAQDLILRQHGVDSRGEPDLSPQDERWLGAWAQEEHDSDFVYVTGFPTAKRAFYTAVDPARPEYTNSFDLLYRGTELVSGGQRLHRYDDYVRRLAERGLAEEPFTAYLEAMRYGMPPHGGFAIGLERLLMQLTGAPTVKLTGLFPRDIHRLTP